jgi:type IV pilus assembly protein PilM
MARRLIGLDVGTNAVTLAEVAAGTPPRLNLFGQVALPRDAMREGEVVDDAAVSEAIERLRTEVGLKKGSVRVGIASPRVIVRQVEMPVMSRNDLASALRFQAPDLIPIPIDEAALDFAVLGTDTPEGAEPTMRVLLAAAQGATISRLVAAVEAGGLGVDAVDLVPLALIRALGRTTRVAPTGENGEVVGGAEGVVSFGGGVTAIVVHEAGVPRFVRVLGTGGRELTDAISAEVELPHEQAESLKRQLASSDNNLVARARHALDRPVGVLVEDVRSSLDYYATQTGAVPLTRVLVTGGGAQLPGLVERLAQAVGVTVEPARPRELLAVGDIGFAEADYPRLDPYIPAAVGLALGGVGGANAGTVINLNAQRRHKVAAPSRSRTLVGAAVGGGLLLVALALPTLARQQQISSANHDVASQQAQNDSLQRNINQLADAREAQQTLERTKAQVGAVLANDVSWAKLLNDLARTMPQNVSLTSFDASVGGPGTTSAPATPSATTTSASTGATPASTGAASPLSSHSASGKIGTATFEATGASYDAVAAWIQRVSAMPEFSQLFVPNAALSTAGTRNYVQFNSTAAITSAARSTDRSAKYEGSGK